MLSNVIKRFWVSSQLYIFMRRPRYSLSKQQWAAHLDYDPDVQGRETVVVITFLASMTKSEARATSTISLPKTTRIRASNLVVARSRKELGEIKYLEQPQALAMIGSYSTGNKTSKNDHALVKYLDSTPPLWKACSHFSRAGATIQGSRPELLHWRRLMGCGARSYVWIGAEAPGPRKLNIKYCTARPKSHLFRILFTEHCILQREDVCTWSWS